MQQETQNPVSLAPELHPSKLVGEGGGMVLRALDNEGASEGSGVATEADLARLLLAAEEQAHIDPGLLPQEPVIEQKAA